MSKLYFNGDIVTMEGEFDSVEALLEEDGMIVKMGNLSDVREVCPSEVVEVDLRGRTLMPSFIDPHGHLSLSGQMITACDLSECTTMEGIVSTLTKYKDEKRIGVEGLIFGVGYDHNFLPDEEHPVKKYLNQVSVEIPICLLHTSAHFGCCNDVVLKLGNITKDTPDPEGGVFGREEGSREPNGYLEENAMFVAMGMMQSRMKFDVFGDMESAQMEYLKNGITTAQDGATNEDNLKMFHMLAEQGKLLIDVVCYPILQPEGKDLFPEYEQYGNRYQNRLKLGGYKAVLDGSPQGKSAWMTKPYENSGDYCAYSWFADEVVEEFMSFAIEKNQQILVHCNGDAAGDQFLGAYVKAYEKSENVNKGNLRPVMIHCQTAREDQLDIMEKYEMIPSIFVGHVYYWGDVHIKNLGQARGERVSPVQSALNRGLVVNFHQDPPVTKAKPLHSAWVAVNRVTRSGKVSGEEQCCSVYDAMKAITINGAYSYFEEDRKGSLKEGKVADMVILRKNPLKVDKMELKDIEILETIKDGVSYSW